MSIKTLPAAAGAVFVLVLGAVGSQHGMEQVPVAVARADEKSAANTPWT
ncbi:hypothetical protein [Streptomyces sp. bgisy084]